MPRSRYLFLVGALGLGGSSVPGHAVESVAEVSAPADRKAKAVQISLAATGESNLYANSDAAHEASFLFEGAVAYNLHKKFKVSGAGGFTKNFEDEGKALITDSALKASYVAGEVFPKGKFSLGFSTLVPTSKDSRKNRGLRTVLTLSPKLSTDLASIGLKGLTVGLTLGLSAGFYKYETAASGASNRPFGIKNTLDIRWAPKDYLALGGTFAQSNAWTYEQNIVQAFEFEQYIEGSHGPVSLALGHRNGGNQLKPNGQDSNLDVFDSNSSVIFSTLSVEL